MNDPPRRVRPSRKLIIGLLAAALALGAGVETVVGHAAVAKTSAPETVVAVASPTTAVTPTTAAMPTTAVTTPIANTPTADQAAAARLDLQMHESDYCNCDR